MESVVYIRLLIICTVLIMAGTACWGFANEVRLRECRRSLLRAEAETSAAWWIDHRTAECATDLIRRMHTEITS